MRIGEPGRDFDEFVVARSPALLRTAVLLAGGDRQLGEDLLQQALVRLASHWKRALDNPDAYVRRVLVNLSRDRFRLLSRRPRTAARVPSCSRSGCSSATTSCCSRRRPG